MASPPLFILRPNTASATSRCSRKARSGSATSDATPPSSAPTTSIPLNIGFYEFSLKQWEGLERRLNFNAMVSQRGTLNLFHTEAQRDLFTRRANQMRLLGVDAEDAQPRVP